MIEIKLTRGYVVIVDDIDADLAQHKWCAGVDKDGRVSAIRRGKKRDGEEKSHYLLHRVIGERIAGRPLTRKDDVDHKYGDRLNNTRDMLRVCTRTQNIQNSKKPSNNTTGFKGVHRLKNAKDCSINKWLAHIRVNRKLIHLGCFPTPEAAHAAYMEAAVKYFGEFARAA